MFDDLFNVGINSGASQVIDTAQAEELLKTLSVGHANGLAAPGSLVGGSALVAESLDSTLKSVTFDATMLVFWPSVAQDRAYSLTEQYVRTNSYGDGGSPYIPESGSPAMNDEEYNRHAQKVVFFSTRRGVSLASTLVRQAVGADPETRASQAGTLWMLEKLEREMYKGLADFSDQGLFDGLTSAIPLKLQNLNLSGAEQQIRQGNTDFSAQDAAFDGYGGDVSVIRSIAGNVMQESDFESLANIIFENYGRANQCHMPPKVMSDFVKQFYPKERVNTLGVLDGRAGYIVKTFSTTLGDVALRPNVFLRPKQKHKAKPDRVSVPANPTDLQNLSSQSVQAGQGNAISQAANPNSLLSDEDIYVYSVSSCNEQGENSAYLISNAVTLSASGNAVSLKITDPSSGYTPTHYAVYRTDNTGVNGPGNMNHRFVGYVARNPSGNTIFVDCGHRIQGSGTAFMLDMRPEVMVWKQLAPLLKINLAPITTAKEFLLWLAGALILFAPRKSGIFENIGAAVN